MGPVTGHVNEPSNIPQAVKCIANIKSMSEMDVAKQIRSNFETVFDDGKAIEKYLKRSSRDMIA